MNLSPATLPKSGLGLRPGDRRRDAGGRRGHRPGRAARRSCTSASSGSTAGSGRCAGCCPPSRPPSPRAGAGWSSPRRTRRRRGWCPGAEVVGRDEPGRGRGALRRRRRRCPRSRRWPPEAVPRRPGALGAGPGRRRRAGRGAGVRSRSPPRAGTTCCMVGPPGTGKTMLAARLPGLLPDLSEADAVEVTAVHSVAGAFDPGDGLLRRPPFEDPHHTATPASVVGGGSGVPRPGAASRAHRGVLFLDEAPEFSTAVLQTLRQPLEHGELVLHRAARHGPLPGPVPARPGGEPVPVRAGGRQGARRARAAASSGAGTSAGCRVRCWTGWTCRSRSSPCRAGGRGTRGSRRPSSPRGCSPRGPRRRSGSAGTPWRTNGEVPGSWLRDAARAGPRAGRGPGPRARPRHAEPARRRPGAAGRVDPGGPGRAGGARRAPTSGTRSCCGRGGSGA